MEKFFTIYVANKKELESYQEKLKQQSCPYCKKFGTLNRHSCLKGHELSLKASAQKLLRGKRVYCSNRGRRGGCGKTFSLLFSTLLKGYLVCSKTLSTFLKALANGDTPKRAWQKNTSLFCLENAYRLLDKFKNFQCSLRTTLSKKQPPPLPKKTAKVAAPLLQTIDHLMNAFAESSCAVSAFQRHFQKGFFSN